LPTAPDRHGRHSEGDLRPGGGGLSAFELIRGFDVEHHRRAAVAICQICGSGTLGSADRLMDPILDPNQPIPGDTKRDKRGLHLPLRR
jgi:hypothetical protein